MRFSTSAILIVLCTLRVSGQSGDYRMGSRAMGMGYASGTLGDEWSGFNNIGALAWEPGHPAVSFSCQTVYSLKELAKKAAVLDIPFGKYCTMSAARTSPSTADKVNAKDTSSPQLLKLVKANPADEIRYRVTACLIAADG